MNTTWTGFKGIIKQLTILGQLEFVDDEEYFVSDGGKDISLVRGKYKNIDTGEVIEANLEFDNDALSFHLLDNI